MSSTAKATRRDKGTSAAWTLSSGARKGLLFRAQGTDGCGHLTRSRHAPALFTRGGSPDGLLMGSSCVPGQRLCLRDGERPRFSASAYLRQRSVDCEAPCSQTFQGHQHRETGVDRSGRLQRGGTARSLWLHNLTGPTLSLPLRSTSAPPCGQRPSRLCSPALRWAARASSTACASGSSAEKCAFSLAKPGGVGNVL